MSDTLQNPTSIPHHLEGDLDFDPKGPLPVNPNTYKLDQGKFPGEEGREALERFANKKEIKAAQPRSTFFIQPDSAAIDSLLEGMNLTEKDNLEFLYMVSKTHTPRGDDAEITYDSPNGKEHGKEIIKSLSEKAVQTYKIGDSDTTAIIINNQSLRFTFRPISLRQSINSKDQHTYKKSYTAPNGETVNIDARYNHLASSNYPHDPLGLKKAIADDVNQKFNNLMKEVGGNNPPDTDHIVTGIPLSEMLGTKNLPELDFSISKQEDGKLILKPEEGIEQTLELVVDGDQKYYMWPLPDDSGKSLRLKEHTIKVKGEDKTKVAYSMEIIEKKDEQTTPVEGPLPIADLPYAERAKLAQDEMKEKGHYIIYNGENISEIWLPVDEKERNLGKKSNDPIRFETSTEVGFQVYETLKSESKDGKPNLILRNTAQPHGIIWLTKESKPMNLPPGNTLTMDLTSDAKLVKIGNQIYLTLAHTGEGATTSFIRMLLIPETLTAEQYAQYQDKHALSETGKQIPDFTNVERLRRAVQQTK